MIAVMTESASSLVIDARALRFRFAWPKQSMEADAIAEFEAASKICLGFYVDRDEPARLGLRRPRDAIRAPLETPQQMRERRRARDHVCATVGGRRHFSRSRGKAHGTAGQFDIGPRPQHKSCTCQQPLACVSLTRSAAAPTNR
jgi:hypothetical protein